MIGLTRGDIRDYIESLASETGRYRLVCCRTGGANAPSRSHGLACVRPRGDR